MLDAMLDVAIAEELRARGWDAQALTENRQLAPLDDATLLSVLADTGRCLVTDNVADFAPLHDRFVAEGRHHAGIVFCKLPRSRQTIGQWVAALDALDAATPGTRTLDATVWVMQEPTSYVPHLSDDEQRRVRTWHEAAYQAVRAEAANGARSFDFLGRTFLVPPDVQPINGMSHLLGEAVLAEVRAADRVLDMGTGCGVNAVLAAATSTDVVAVDINPSAVMAARNNAARNRVADRVAVLEGDVFSPVDGRFDVVIFDPPFRWFAPRDLLEAATTDENYRALTTFFANVRDHLTPRGRVVLFFGTSGDLAYLHRLVAAAGFATETLATASHTRDGWQVDYFTFRLTL
jgi:release factor glutamine methyltransferase